MLKYNIGNYSKFNIMKGIGIMKKFISTILSAAMLTSAVVLPAYAADDEKTEEISYNYVYDIASGYVSDNTYTRQMEKLSRGLVAINTGSGVYLSWRLFDSEDTLYGSADSNVSFNVYRNGEKIAEVSDKTNYTDTSAGSAYSVAPVINGAEGEKCEAVSVMSDSYFDIPLDVPDDETIYDTSGNELYTASFFPADCSTGDVDGDGEYEIIIKWTSMEKDVGSPGTPEYSGTVRLAAYKLDGTKLWDNDINLGKNVYSSAHTVQFLVYDFDLDGKSEVMCQTSLGSKDAAGIYVSHSAKDDAVIASSGAKIADFTDEDNENADYRGSGRIVTGEEFLTVFNGETGEAIDTIDLPTTRGSALGVDYGDDFGNRSNRFVSDVAYLDGEKPYAVYLRGYYFGKNGRQRTSIAGISFDGERLSPDYRFDTQQGQPGYYEGAYNYVGNGNHNCTVADVDNDGKDEFITGALCMEVNDDNEFRPLWCTHKEHGDALHIGDYDPTHPGLEFFTVHEDGDKDNTTGGYGYTNSQNTWCDFGMSVIDAATGEIMFHEGASDDTGRGVMANIGMGGYYQIWSAKNDLYMSNGGTNYSKGSKSGLSQNFRIFWDGDLYDELLDGTTVTSWNGRSMSNIFSATGCTKINGTKSNPALQADLFGDWREELVYPTTDGTKLRVFTTTTPTEYKIKTLMHDPVYRSGVAAEQTAYNQPPHVGIYLNEDLFGSPISSITIKSAPNKTVYAPGENLDTTGMVVEASYEDGTTKDVDAFSVSGYDSAKVGKQTITVTYMDKTASFDITVKEIDSLIIASKPKDNTVYQNGILNTDGLVVKVIYSDNTSSEVSGYTLSGYDTSKLGTQTVTVTYMGSTAAFDIIVKSPAVEALNRSYSTDSTASVLTTIPIGSYSDTFTLEHTVKINSMPANGNNDKNSTAGFFVRFMASPHTGGGWYLTQSGSQAQVIWKNTRTTNVAKIDIGKTYTFKYEFSNVGTGEGALVTLLIIDADGNVIASQKDLNLRNFSDTDTGKKSPITTIEVYNQASSGSTSDVVFDNAVIYGDGKIISVDGKDITLSLNTLAGMKVYAAKYTDDGALAKVEILSPKSTGESTLTASFEPDKVFLWGGNMRPIDCKEAEAVSASPSASLAPTVSPEVTEMPDIVSTSSPKETETPTSEPTIEPTSSPVPAYTVTVTVTDSNGAPLKDATVQISKLKASSGGSDDETLATSAPTSESEIEPTSAQTTNPTTSPTDSSNSSGNTVIAEQTTDGNGIAVFEDIPSGSYMVYATHELISGWKGNIMTVSANSLTKTIKLDCVVPEATAEPTITQKLMSAQPQNENYIISPLSLKLAMMMIANGAENETQNEIISAFGMQDINSANDYAKNLISDFNSRQNAVINIADSIWINKDFFGSDADFSDEFKAAVAEYYSGTAQFADNETLGTDINSWVNEKTNGLIPKLISEETTDTSKISSALINTVYLNARWTSEFSAGKTAKDIFFSIDGEEQEMDFMNQTDNLKYYEDTDTQMVQIPYNGNLSMWLVLGDSSSFETDKELAEYTKIALSVPKFKTAYGTELSDVLKSMGILKAFEDYNSDFDIMFKNISVPMKISNVMQKAIISVDEEGTEASSVTAIIPAPGAAAPDEIEPIEFKADQPFTYFITDYSSGEIIFAGRFVKQPLE